MRVPLLTNNNVYDVDSGVFLTFKNSVFNFLKLFVVVMNLTTIYFVNKLCKCMLCVFCLGLLNVPQ